MPRFLCTRRWKWGKIPLVAFLVLALAGEVLAHIPTRSPYREGVGEQEWALASNVAFGLCQVLGWAYLAAALHLQGRRALWMSVAVALLFQIVVGLIFFPVTILISFSTREMHIAYTSFEAPVVRPDLVTGILIVSAITFAVAWGLSALLLLLVRGVPRRWLTGLIHALVLHPFAIPIGALIGLMHILYLWQIPGEPRPV